MKKIARLVLFFIALTLYSHIVKHVLEGGQELGVFTKPFKEFVLFISTTKDLYLQIQADVDASSTKKVKEPINNLEESLYVLNSVYSSFDVGWEVQLRDLLNDSLLYTWRINESDYIETNIVPSRRIKMNPLLLEDSSIIIVAENTHTLYRIDKNSQLKWKQKDIQTHHSVNLDVDNNLWVCTRKEVFVKQYNKWGISYTDQGIAKLNIETGEPLYEKSVSQILIENNLQSLLLGSSNGEQSLGQDPLHLNDVEMVDIDGVYMKKGDLFLSIRNRSVIIHFRPSTNKVLRVINGPFISQHDVDILNDSTISVFNNNRVRVPVENIFRDDFQEREALISIDNSNIVTYNLANGKYDQPFDSLLRKKGFYSHDQGLHTYLPGTGWILENQNHAELLFINESGQVLYDGVLSEDKDTNPQHLHWCRFYTDLSFLNQ